MHFKTTVNKSTGKRTHYVDSKKVAPETYDFKYYICQQAGMNYNSSLTTSDKNYIRHSFYMD